ncbi:MAG: hypothetical protein DWQ36_25280 [Acidobacteria bacterium]|nr:MAG: hypothetical protein DWQ30_02110 [Acidobacteriota bacterium]REJ99532.1 MAG: hypothetical protein DWQ36_25280 [Acidobacteriota bacterium]
MLLHASQRAARRARGFAVFLFVNWIVMGWYVLRAPSGVVGAMAFVLGIVCLLAALGQMRGMRDAGRLPLVEIDGDVLRFRRFTARAQSEVRFDELRPDVEVDRSHLQVTTRGGEVHELPWLALEEEDRKTLEDALRSRLEPDSAARRDGRARGEDDDAGTGDHGDQGDPESEDPP